MKTARLIFLLALLPFFLAAQLRPKLHILSVGVDKYTSTQVSDLEYTDNDARTSRRLFRSRPSFGT